MYLGDGCISQHPRTQRLRIVLDAKYPGIIQDTRALLGRCFPRNEVDVVSAPGCVHVSTYCSHLSCLFPEQGPGPKHQRRIVLEPWQQRIVNSAPWPFIRGCIRTDGCAFINRTRAYEYLRYDFCNMSSDVVGILVRACEVVGVSVRVTHSPGRAWRVRINRRASVARMLEHVGVKT